MSTLTPLNNSYDEAQVLAAVSVALTNFYTSLTQNSMKSTSQKF